MKNRTEPMSYTYAYPRPAVTTDVVLWRMRSEGGGRREVLLIQRRNDPFREHWALPGGFLDEDEAPIDGANRELKEETGLADISLAPLGFWGTPGRDPRGHTLSLVFIGEVRSDQAAHAKAADDAKDLQWFSEDKLPPLAFDHAEIVATALAREKP